MKRLLLPPATLTALKKMAFTFLCCTLLMVFAAPARAIPSNQGPPAGAILDLNGTPIPGGGNETYQQYTVNFTATLTSTAITFAFRDDPAQISFAYPSVQDVTGELPGPNLLTNGDLSGGVYTSNGNSGVPIGWTYANAYGATAGGFVVGPSPNYNVSNYCYFIDEAVVNYCWFDGAVQAYDAISQTIPTTLGHTYRISFYVAESSGIFSYPGNPVFPPGYPGSDCWAAAHGVTDPFPCNFRDLSTNGDTTDGEGNGINVTVYAQEGLPGLASQTQTLAPGVQTTYSFNNGAEKYKITPSPYSLGGETLTITQVPILKSGFIPPANFPNETCVPFADVTLANGVDTCVGFQAECSFGGVPNGGDCETLLYTLLESYDLPPDLPAIGGPDFLVVHFSGCPTSSTALAQSIFLDYYVTRIDPTSKGGGGGVGSCFEVTYTPGAPPITSGSTSRLVGWQSPVVDGNLNQVKAGSTRPLIFTWNDTSGNPITNLSYCNSFKTTIAGNVCQDSPTVKTPWVNLASFGIACPNGAPANPATDDPTLSTAGASGFQHLGGGDYQMNWKIPTSWKGSCANVQVTFDNGVTEIPATLGFQFN